MGNNQGFSTINHLAPPNSPPSAVRYSFCALSLLSSILLEYDVLVERTNSQISSWFQYWVRMLEHLTTEARNPASEDLDGLTALQIVQLINSEDAKIAAAVAEQSEVIASAIDVIA